MKYYEASQTINGSNGEVWIDNEYIAQITGLEAKVTVEKAEVTQVGKRSKGYKNIGIEGKGTIKMNKVDSFFIKKLSDAFKKGKTPTSTIISKLSDPDAAGTERIKLTGCTFDELALANWEARKIGEESIPFSFEDWEIIESI